MPMDAAAFKAARRAVRASEAEGAVRIASLFGYTADANPFGDSNVTQQFVWKKKIERDISSGVAARAPTAAEAAAKRDDLLTEVEAAKERRRRREAEKEEMERLRAEEDRLKDAAQYAGWEAKEEAFLRRQAATRSLLRIREGRERPVDAIARNLVLARATRDGDAEARGDLVATGVQLDEPLIICARLSVRDLLELAADAADMAAADAASAAEAEGSVRGSGGDAGDALSFDAGIAFWHALGIVVRDVTVAARQAEAAASSAFVHASVAIEADIEAAFRGKRPAELIALEQAIAAVLGGGSSSNTLSAAVGMHSTVDNVVVDFDYWQRSLRILHSIKARAALRYLHETLLSLRLSQLEGGGGAGAAAPPTTTAPVAAKADPYAGSYSPLADEEEGGRGAGAGGAGAPPVVDADEDRRRLLEQRVHILRSRGLIAPEGGAPPPAVQYDDTPGLSGENDEMALDEHGNPLPMGAAEADLGADAEVPLPPGVARVLSATDASAFADKYRPRKPRFFNRVKTGYDWNKYNKSHYDKDNPPPKNVQGYMFNIFYPDLLDRTRTPSFRLESCADSEGYCIVRFSGGPPYEDVAFKIVNREWDRNRKRGFRCTFDHGNLTVNFNFKGHRYRA